MMRKIRAFTLFFILIFNLGMLAQAVHLEGNIFSYNSKKLVLIKKAQKDLNFEGPLPGALIKCVGKESSSSFNTGIDGFFSVELGKPGIYQITINKPGYSSVSFVINYRSAAKKTYFESLFLILKQEENSIMDLGTIEIENDKLGFLKGNSKNASSVDVFNSNTSLLEKAVNINNNSKSEQFAVRPADATKLNADNRSDTPHRNRAILPADKIELARGLSSENLDSLKQNIANSKDLLNNLSPESDDYKILSLQISNALQKVKDKEKVISLLDAQLSDSRKIILYLALFLLFLAFSLGVSFYFFREKKKFSFALLAINEKISKINSRLLSSIRYASVIQENFLRSP
ncbi:MAG TPA: carboxypeptidase-like regulatory domain-containing protein, partial [Bacteroidia bacterium]|nr:carboxypeptidase-like regulatory domain-containing protein [Bacteroidia bacterium]